jgi:DNA-binding transcriptional ArsR family regulator
VNLAGLDPVVHAPKRLAAMAILNASEWVESAFLREQLGLSDSDLSKQMSALLEAGYTRVQKRGSGRGPSTWFRITRTGRRAFDGHVAALNALVAQAGATPERETEAPDRA